MEAINGHMIGSLPIKNLKKVSDLLEYEGPILSHFTGDKNNNYLFYWTDFDNKHNRWLVWKVSKYQLYQYLTGLISLRDMVNEGNKDYVYSVDIDDELNYTNVNAILLDEIPEAYLPEEDSVFKFPVPTVYQDLVNTFEESSHLALLRSIALYFTMEPTNLKHGRAVPAIDAGDFLKKLSSSFLSFVETDFIKRFKGLVPDFETLQRTAEQFKEALTPRIAYTTFGSFKVGISTDIIYPVESDKYSAWQREILFEYQKEVVDVNYSDEGQLREIALKYDEHSRKKIFGPYLDIINDTDYTLKVTNINRSFKRSYGRVTKQKQQIILPKKQIEEAQTEKRKLYSVILEAREGEDFTKISKKQFQEGLLFAPEPVDKVIVTLHDLRYGFPPLELLHPISYTLALVNNFYIAESTEFGINVTALTKEEVHEAFQKRFAETFMNIRDDEDSPLRRAYMEAVRFYPNAAG